MRHLYFGEVRSTESRILEGRALSFGVESKILCEDGRYFTETLRQGCITQDTIDGSNIILNYNHTHDDVLGRSNHGKGTLELDLRDDGLYFRVKVPNTRFGDEMLELVNRQDICSCSFAFTVDEDGEIWTRNTETNLMHREITKISELFDVSIVVTPAYDQTYVQARSLELAEAEKKNLNTTQMESNTKDELMALKAIVDEMIAKVEADETRAEEVEDESSDTEAVEVEETKTEEVEDESSDAEPAEETETVENEEKRSINITDKNKNSNNIIMKKNITLVQQITRAMNNNERKFTVSLENRAMTVNKKTEGDEADPYAVGETAVTEEYQSIVEPLYNDQVFAGLGVHMYTGAPKGDYNFPVLGKGTVGFAKEIAKATESGNTTTNVHLSPKRICGYVDISKQLLLQDTLGINEAIRRDLYNAIADAIQNAMFDAEAKDETRPAGLLNGVAESDKITNFKGLCELEAGLQDVNFKNIQYLVSNGAYASLRNLAKSAKSTELVLENGEIDGVKCTRTGALTGKTIVVADFSQVAMAVWSDAEIVVDEVSQAVNGVVRLVISAYVDWAWVRPNAIKVTTID